jgi:hypothetical protein
MGKRSEKAKSLSDIRRCYRENKTNQNINKNKIHSHSRPCISRSRLKIIGMYPKVNTQKSNFRIVIIRKVKVQ